MHAGHDAQDGLAAGLAPGITTASVAVQAVAVGPGSRLRRLVNLRAGDRAAIRGHLEALSPTSRYYRFGTPVPRVEDRLVDALSDLDGEQRRAWGAFEGEELVAVGHLARVPHDPTTAEFALSVADPAQGRGLGRRMLRRLAIEASRAGISQLSYYVLGENRRMLRLLAAAGVSCRIRGGAAEGVIPPAALAASLERGPWNDAQVPPSTWRT